jgi:hypothetical protein
VAITSFLSTKIVAHLNSKNINSGGCTQKGNNVCRVGKRKCPLFVVAELLYGTDAAVDC